MKKLISKISFVALFMTVSVVGAMAQSQGTVNDLGETKNVSKTTTVVNEIVSQGDVTVLEKTDNSAKYEVNIKDVPASMRTMLVEKLNQANNSIAITGNKATITLTGFWSEKITPKDLPYVINHINRLKL